MSELLSFGINYKNLYNRVYGTDSERALRHEGIAQFDSRHKISPLRVRPKNSVDRISRMRYLSDALYYFVRTEFPELTIKDALNALEEFRERDKKEESERIYKETLNKLEVRDAEQFEKWKTIVDIFAQTFVPKVQDIQYDWEETEIKTLKIVYDFREQLARDFDTNIMPFTEENIKNHLIEVFYKHSDDARMIVGRETIRFHVSFELR